MILRRLALGCALAASSLTAAAADTSERAALHALIAKHAKANGLPESLVHRVVRRESNYNPRAYSRGNWGLMQIRHGTARGMGYAGSAAGLLDANTNLSYAVPYLANAYKVAGGNHDRAVALYARGFYYDAKRMGMLGRLKKGPTGSGPETEVAQAQPATPTLGTWLAAAFTPPAQAQTQQVAAAQPDAAAQPEAEEPAEAADKTSKRKGKRDRMAALAKADALKPAAAKRAAGPKAAETGADAGTALKPASKVQTRLAENTTVALRQTASEEPVADKAPAPSERAAKPGRKPRAKVAKAEPRPKQQLARTGLALPPELPARR